MPPKKTVVKKETPMAKKNREHTEKMSKMTPMARRNYEHEMKKKRDASGKK